MRLYFGKAACSLAVHITLRELGEPFELVEVDLVRHRTRSGEDFFAISPRGYVPLLELDDGTRLTEAAALLQLLAERDPSLALIGAPGSPRRHAVLGWLAFVATELHKGFSPWLWHRETADSTRQAVLQRLHGHFAELDAVLATQPFLAGAFSIADAYAFTILNWSRILRLPMEAYPHIGRYLARVGARPAVAEAWRAEGLRPMLSLPVPARPPAPEPAP